MSLPLGLAILIKTPTPESNSSRGLVLQDRTHHLASLPPEEEEIEFEIRVSDDYIDRYWLFVAGANDVSAPERLIARVGSSEDGKKFGEYHHRIRIRNCSCRYHDDVSIRHSIFLVLIDGTGQFQVEEMKAERLSDGRSAIEVRNLVSGRVEDGEIVETIFTFIFPQAAFVISLVSKVFDLSSEDVV